MNELWALYLYTWKCHNETPCITVWNKQKCLFFFFLQKQRTRQKNVLSVRIDSSEIGGDIRKGIWRVNMLEIFCTHVCKLKNKTCWNYPRNGGRDDKGEWWRGWIQLWYVVRTSVNVTMYSQYNNNKNKVLKNFKNKINKLIIASHKNYKIAWFPQKHKSTKHFK
jgi:hypothetical protein